MTALKTDRNYKNTIEHNLFKSYYWFQTNLSLNLENLIKEFFDNDYNVRLISITKDENLLFYGDEYFVNKIPINKNTNIKIKISAKVISSFLDIALGPKEENFELKDLTDIEAMLIKSFTLAYNKLIEKCIDTTEPSKKILQNSHYLHFTHYIEYNKKHLGKIILSMPEYIIPAIEPNKTQENFSITNFTETKTELKIEIGKSRLTLNEVKAMEDGDIIVLEKSNINTMLIKLGEKEIQFKINPNPSIIINIDNNGGNNMEDETSKSPNMWDSILVDIVAEFDNVKLTLGELKQISEGLVIDVGSVYENKIKLRVENQVVATGELVILNDRYGVRIEEVKKSKEQQTEISKNKEKEINNEAQPTKPNVNEAVKKTAVKPSAAQKPVNTTQAKQKPSADSKENENFDYSDFEIEDESI